MPHSTDLDLTARDVAELASSDALAALLTKLGYDTADRTLLSPEAVGLAGEAASGIKRIELLSEDPEQFLRVVFAQPKALTARVRNDLVRVLGKSNLDHLLILAADFDWTCWSRRLAAKMGKYSDRSEPRLSGWPQ